MTKTTKILALAAAIVIIGGGGIAYGGKFPSLEESLRVVPLQKLTVPSTPTVKQVPFNEIAPLTPEEADKAAAGIEKRRRAVDGGQVTQAPTKEILRASELGPYYADNLKQSGKVDQHVTVDPTLKDVTICGAHFKARQVVIDGVDVVQYLAKTLPQTHDTTRASESIQASICNTLGTSNPSRDTYGDYKVAELPVLDVTKQIDSQGHQGYFFAISALRFEVDATNGDIYHMGAYDGTPQLIGNIKK